MGAVRRRLPALATASGLAGAVGVHVSLLVGWIRADARPERSICCELVGPVVQRAAWRAEAAAGMHPAPWGWDRGLLPILGERALRLLGGDPDGLLLVNVAAMVVAQAAAFVAARRLGGRLAGVLAAAWVPTIPALALSFRRWDVYGAQAAVLLVAFALLVSSRGLTRPLGTAGFAAAALVGAFLSPRETDGFLVVGALGAMGLGAGLRGLATGRDATGVARARWATVLGGAAVVGGVSWALVQGVRFTSPEGLGYYLRESGTNSATVDPATWAHRAAYLGRLYWRDLTPWLAVPVEVALVAWLARGRGRAELAAWLLLPTTALSLLAKKNHYYLSVVHPGAALALALGVAALPGGAVVRGVAAAGVTAVALTQLVARTAPDGALAGATAGVAWQGGDPTWGGVFQTGDADMDLAPDASDGGAAALADAVLRAVPVATCGCGTWVRGLGNGPWAAVGLRLADARPCLQVRRGGRPDDAVVALLGPGVRPDDPARSAVRNLPDLTLRETVPTPAGDIEVWALTPAAQARRCVR